MRAIRRGEVDLNIILVCLGLPTEVPPIRRTGQGPVGMGVLAPGIPTRRLPVSQTGRAGMRDSGRQAAGERAGGPLTGRLACRSDGCHHRARTG